MSLKLVRKTLLGESVVTYQFENSSSIPDPTPVHPDPAIVDAVRNALEQARMEAGAASTAPAAMDSTPPAS
jgi:hypothetical protein